MHNTRRSAALRLRQLIDEVHLLTSAFPDLRDAFDPDELPIEFILRRDSQAAIHTRERSRAPQLRATSPASVLLQRVENEYREMPGLILTEEQARRLWAIDSTTCRGVLATLLERRFLKRTAAGAYVRASD